MSHEGSQSNAAGPLDQDIDRGEAARDPWVGRNIAGTYTLTRFIGSGGVGRVYEATSRSVSRQFAVKIVDPEDDAVLESSPNRIRERLEREIDAQSQLRNPHIVQLFDVVELPEGKLAIIMDLVRGETLRQLIHRRGPLEVERACNILRQVANGVHEAHEAGLVHRDLKPANLMVEVLPAGDDFVRVFDFGIVCVHNDISEDNQFIGTPLFASPEQARGERIDRRSDIYSLGAVLFYMLTGRAPFLADQPFQVLLAHCQKQAPKLSDVRPGRNFPDQLEDLVARLLAKRRDERPGTLAQVISELDALPHQSGEPFERGGFHQSSLGERKSAVTVVSEAIDEGAPPRRQPCLNDGPAPSAQVLFSKQQASAPAQDSRKLAHPTSDVISTPTRRANALIERPKSDLVAPFREVLVPRSMAGCPWSVTADGRVVYLTQDGHLRLLDPILGTEWSKDLDFEGRGVSLALSRGMAYVGTLDGEVLSFSFAEGEKRTIYRSPYRMAIDSLAVDRAGRWLVLSNCNGEVRCAGIDGKNNPAWRRIQANAARVKVDVADDGSKLAILAGASRVLVHATEWPHKLLAQVDVEEPMHCIRLSKNGTKIAGITQQWQLGAWRLPDGRLLGPLRPLNKVLSIGYTTGDELVLLRTE